MASLRLLYRGSVLLLGTVFLWALWALGMPFAALAGRRGAWRNRAMNLWGRFVARVLRIRIRREGRPPSGGFLLVANHLSYLDIPVLASQIPTVFVSKAEVANWPLIGWMARSVGVLFLRREDKRDLLRVATAIERELEAGNGLVFFPEGTSSRGAEVLPFRPSLLAPAARAGLPVSYAVLHYQTPEGSPPASTSVCWWGDMPFGPHALQLLRLPHVDATVRFGDAPLEAADRKNLAQQLWEAVQARFVPVK